MTRKWLAVAVVSTVALASPSSRADDAKPIALRFAWPDRIVLRVERAFERTDQGPRAAAPLRSTSRFTWTGMRSGDGYRVGFSDFAVVQEEPRPRSKEPMVQLEYLQRALEPLLPALVLDASAAPLRLEGLAELREKLRKEYAAIPDLSKDPRSEQLLSALTSEAALTARALEDWNRAVQTWHGADTEVGATMEQEGPPIQLTESVTVPNLFSYRVDSRVRCVETEPEPACLRLIVSQTPRISDSRAASRALLGFDFVQALGAPPDAKLEVVNTFTTDTEPSTLVPVRYVKEKRWSVSWRDASGAERVVGRTDRWSYVFSRAD